MREPGYRDTPIKLLDQGGRFHIGNSTLRFILLFPLELRGISPPIKMAESSLQINMNRDYYAELDVPPTANAEEIKRSYRKLGITA